MIVDFIMSDTDLSKALKKINIYSFNDAIHYVNQLPYGRNRGHCLSSVLEEKCGTCSSKHAFLAELAQENNYPVQLMLGYYLMDKKNTPGIGNILESYHLPYVLEAHCYLKYQSQYLDITFPSIIKTKLDIIILEEQEILPKDIHHKVRHHQEKLKQWLSANSDYPMKEWEVVWQIREACIQALANTKD